MPRSRIGANQGVIIFLPDTNSNYGAFKYKATFTSEGALEPKCRRITIRNEITHKDWTKWIGLTKTFITTYKIKYESDGTLPSNGNGEISWSLSGKPTKVYYKQSTAPLMNQNLSKTELENIYK